MLNFLYRRPVALWRIALPALAFAVSACSFSPLAQDATPAPVASAPSSPPAATAAEPPAATAAVSSDPAATPVAPASGVAQAAGGPALLTGKFTYSNDIITTYYVEQAAALVDMYGFVKRDQEWKMPIDSQVLGYLTIDQQNKRGEYRIQLPERPLGQLVDVSQAGKGAQGVQIFAASYWPNTVGGPYSEGDDPSYGWPSYLASTVNDSENENEVIGGKLVVWAPDAAQQFPTAFGPDGKLFTSDDPVGAIPAGYSVVDLDKQPFAFSQAAEQELPLYEPKDAAIKDFSSLSYSEAFKQMVDKLKVEYAFNGVAGKAPDWSALDQEFTPRVAEAERNRDPVAFSSAIHDFTLQFHDGHVGANDPVIGQLFRKDYGGGYGFAVRELDDKRVIATFVLKGGPAEQAGMVVGAEISAFGDQPIARALGAVQPFEGPFSTDFGLRTAQERYLVRAPVDTEATVTFANPGKTPITARLKAIGEFQSYLASFPPQTNDPAELPVEARTLPSGTGYIKISSNYDDLGLIIRLFQRALESFSKSETKALIIDMRVNPGGAPLGLAGFLTDKEIQLGQIQYYSDKTGKFEPRGNPDKVRPNIEQYHFDKLALLVDQTCASACEIESYGFSKVPGMMVVGQYPTGGIEAEVSRGQFKLPEGIEMQFPTGRMVLPDGSLFLEGQGVQPTVRVPIDERSVLSKDDAVLGAAEQAIGR